MLVYIPFLSVKGLELFFFPFFNPSHYRTVCSVSVHTHNDISVLERCASASLAVQYFRRKKRMMVLLTEILTINFVISYSACIWNILCCRGFCTVAKEIFQPPSLMIWRTQSLVRLLQKWQWDIFTDPMVYLPINKSADPFYLTCPVTVAQLSGKFWGVKMVWGT